MNAAMLFGKLPAHGDFVARGMSDADRGWWDENLSLAIAQAMDTHGDAFAARYDAAVPWCFHIRQGTAMVTGAIAPSADRVGRRFPVVLAHRQRSGAAACAALLMTTRNEGWNADMLIDRFGDATHEAAAVPRGWWPSDAPTPAAAAVIADTPVPALTAMLAAVAS